MREPEMTKAPPVEQMLSQLQVSSKGILRTSSPRRYTCEDRCEKDGNKEGSPCDHACDAGLRTIGNAGR